MRIERTTPLQPNLHKQQQRDVKQTIVNYRDCAGLSKTIVLPHHATVQHIKSLVTKRGGSRAQVLRAVYRTNGQYVCEVGL